MGKGYTISSAERLSFGWGDRPLFDLLVEVVSERGLGLLAERLALLLRAEPLLRPLARTRHRLLRAGDRPLHGNRHARLAKVRRDATPLGFGEDGKRVSS